MSRTAAVALVATLGVIAALGGALSGWPAGAPVDPPADAPGETRGNARREAPMAQAADPVLEQAQATAAAIHAQTGGASPAPPARSSDTPSAGPKRRDGFWEMTSVREDGSVRGKQSLCVGGGSEDKFSVWDQITVIGNCNRQELARAGAGWTFDARCELFGMVNESKGTISGDFRDRFRVDLAVVSDGRREAGSIRGEHKGACPAAFKPGDLVSEGRVLMNVLN